MYSFFDDDDVEAMVPKVRELARQGCFPSDILRVLAEHSGGAHVLFAIKVLRQAFDIPLAKLTILAGGAINDRGEMVDSRINEELGLAIAEKRSVYVRSRSVWDQESI